MRRAEWRRRADDPKTALGWWWRGMTREGGLLMLATYLWVALSMTLLPLPWGASVGVLGYVLYGGLRAFGHRDELRPLLPDPPPPGQFRASAVYRRDGLTTGRDDLVLTVVEGWLVAEGVRSHFAIQPEDALEWNLTRDRGVVTLLPDGTEIDLSWTGEENGRTLSGWRWSTGPEAGESTFPPARAHPQEVARLKAWTLGGLVFAFAAGGVASLLGLWPSEEPFVVAIMVLGLAVAYFSRRTWGRLIDDRSGKWPAALSEPLLPLQSDRSETSSEASGFRA